MQGVQPVVSVLRRSTQSLPVLPAATLSLAFDQQCAGPGALRPFLVDYDGSGGILPYGQVRALAIGVASVLRKRFCPVDQSTPSPIAVLSENSASYVVLLVGAWYAGLPLLLLPATLPPSVAVELVRASAAGAVLYDHSLASRAAALRALHPDLADGGELDAVVPSPLGRAEAAAEDSAMLPGQDPDRTCVVLSTSGSTTGTSVKAVPLTPRNLLASCVSRAAHWVPETIGPEDGVLGWLPLSHVMGLLLDLLNTAIVNGARYVIFRPGAQPLPVALLSAIRRHEPTFASAVPWLLESWRTMAVQDASILGPLRSLRALLVGGAPLRPDLASFFLERGVPLMQSAGMTETAGSLFTGRLLNRKQRADPAALAGAYPLWPHATLDYDIILAAEEHGQTPPSDEVEGELVIVDTPTLTAGYLNAPEANTRAFLGSVAAPGRRFRTGDLVRVRRATDGEQRVEYVRRVDDVVTLSTGEKLDPVAFETDVLSRLGGAAVGALCLLGQQQPFPFLAVEIDADAEASKTEVMVWEAVKEANARHAANCRVRREAVLLLRRGVDESLPLSRKRQVIRALAERRFAPQMTAIAARLSLSGTPARSLADASMSPIVDQVAELLGLSAASLRGQEGATLVSLGVTSLLSEQLARRLGIPVAALYEHSTLRRLVSFLATSEISSASLAASRALSAREDPYAPVAVIGLACRLPGGLASPSAVWAALSQAADLCTDDLSSRWPDLARRVPEAPSRGGLLLPEHWSTFDRRFFGFTPAEASTTDPRHRLALELSWEALENAGILPSSLVGTDTAVYVSQSADHAGWEGQLALKVPLEQMSAYQAAGGSSAATAGRVSFALGLRGPSMVVDTACSSGGVALDLACNHLRSAPPGSVALVLGTQVMVTPAGHVSLTRAGALSPHSRCATFDESADGYVRSDGCVAVVLRRMTLGPASDSSSSSHDPPPWCELLGAGITHGGDASNGLTAPSPLGQETAIRLALARARVSPAEISFVESHGTGTRLGDPIEAEVLGRVYGAGRARPLLVGAVKTNIGHSEAASGLCGLLKVALCMRHHSVPANIHFSRLNSRISSLASTSLSFPRVLTPWTPDPGQKSLLAGLSTFGFTGTNAHLILRSGATLYSPSTPRSETPLVLPLAALSRRSLASQALRWADYLAASASSTASFWSTAANTCYTAALHREHFFGPMRVASSAAVRTAIVAERAERLPDLLRSLAASSASSVPDPISAPRVAIVLAGQGLKTGGLGAVCRRLSELSRAFAETLQLCERAYLTFLESTADGRSFLPPSLLLSAADSTPIVSQTALVSFEVALVALWRSWGVAASLLCGHSLGEIAAAVVSGSLSLADGVRLSAAREYHMLLYGPAGSMAAILAKRETAEALLEQVRAAHGRDSIVLAALNGPTHHVAAGTPAAVAALLELPSEVRRIGLPVSRAFHSPFLGEAVRKWAATHTVTSSDSDDAVVRPLLLSTATAVVLEPAVARSMAHWSQHALSPVRFHDTLLAVAGRADVVLAINPAGGLGSMIRRSLPSDFPSHRCIDSVQDDRDAAAALLEAAGRLFSVGVKVDWVAIYSDLANLAGVARFSMDVALPTYAWDREPVLPIGDDTPSAPPPPCWVMNEQSLSLLAQHVVDGEALLPGAAQLAFLLRYYSGIAELDFTARAPLRALHTAPSPESIAVLALRTQDSTSAEVELQWQPAGPESPMVCATARTGTVPPSSDSISLDGAISSCTEELQAEDCYSLLRQQGLDYGPAFRRLTKISRSADKQLVLGTLEYPSDAQQPATALAALSAVLDACLHLGSAFSDSTEQWIPVRMAGISLRSPLPPGPALLCVQERLAETDPARCAARVSIYHADTRQLLLVIGRYTSGLALEQHWLRTMQWRAEVPSPPSVAPSPLLLLFPDAGGICAGYAQHKAGRTRKVEISRLQDEKEEALLERISAVFNDLGPMTQIEIVFGWTLDRPAAEQEDAMLALRSACGLLLSCLKAIAESAPPSVSMCVLTRGAVVLSSVPPHSVRLEECAAAAVQGFVGVAATELAQVMRLWTLDLPNIGQGESVILPVLLRRLDHGPPPLPACSVALDTAGNSFCPRLEPCILPPPSDQPVLRLDPRAGGERVAVVTGGFGGVGQHLASWLMWTAPEALRCSTVVLLGRSLPADPPQIAARLAAAGRGASVLPAAPHRFTMQQRGRPCHTVLLRQCDITSEASVQALIAEVQPQIVVHSAAALADKSVTSMTLADLDIAFGAKAAGAWLLQRWLPSSCLLLLCSSVSLALRTPGQANYAAANGFVEALAARRNGSAIAVAWGPWLGVGMAKDMDLAASPCRPMAPRRALRALSILLGSATAPATAMLADLRAAAHAPAQAKGVEPRPEGTAPVGVADLPSVLRAAVAEVLGRSPAELTMSADEPLLRYGLDSLAAMELRTVLSRRAQRRLPLRAFRAPSFASLFGEMQSAEVTSIPPTGAATAAGQPVAASPPPPVASLAPGKWLLPVVGDAMRARQRVIVFNDAGGDPANFRIWAKTWPDPDVAVLAVHLPHHTSRLSEPACPTLAAAAAGFIADSFPWLSDRSYVLYGQCIGAYFAVRFAEEIRRRPGLRQPSALIASACPGPDDLTVLTRFTDRALVAPQGSAEADEHLRVGLRDLTLAIGFTEQDWQRLSADAGLYASLVADVRMTDLGHAVGTQEPPLCFPVLALLGAADPVVKRPHLASWLATSGTAFHMQVLPSLGHNIQYEPQLIEAIATWLRHLDNAGSG